MFKCPTLPNYIYQVYTALLSGFHNSVQWDHHSDTIMGAMTSQLTSVSIVYSNICSGADQRKHPSSVSLAFVRRIHRWPVNSQHKGPEKRKMFPFDDVIMSKGNEWTGIQVQAQVPGELLPLIWRDLRHPGPPLNIKTVFPMYGIPMLKIRRSRDRLIFNMG